MWSSTTYGPIRVASAKSVHSFQWKPAVMRMTYDGREEERRFKLRRNQCQRVPPVLLADLDFPDDPAIFEGDFEQAQ